MKRVVYLVVPALLIAWLAVGQAPAPAPAGKIAVVDVQQVMNDTADGKAATADLERKYAPKQKELQALQADIQRLQTELQQKQASMNDAERQRRAIEIQRKQRDLERANEDIQAEFNRDMEEARARLGRRVTEVVQKFGAERQFSLIMDAAQSGTLYAGAGTDITKDVVAAYNQQHPAKPAQ